MGGGKKLLDVISNTKEERSLRSVADFGDTENGRNFFLGPPFLSFVQQQKFLWFVVLCAMIRENIIKEDEH